MSTAASPEFDFSEKPAHKRFVTVNRDRLRRVTDSLSQRQRDFVDLLPLLFHINHPLLPGYVARDTPFGIADYSPTAASLRAARRVARSFEIDRRSPPRFAIRGLYMMGSPGTIAYSRSSDIDLWLVHHPELDAEGIAALATKAHLIEAFADGIGLEVHFFVFDAERFRAGETLSLSEESSGSSQHSVLLDEFYRSALLVAGLPPTWWYVPSRYDGVYQAYVARAIERRVIDPRDSIDFGALPTIPAEEFFGAAVWQLYKSIESPYKSVLKLLLMEAYAAEYPDIKLLCSRYKQNIEAEQADLNALDPYMLMYTKVEEHLMARNDATRLDVLRRSFYIKANVRVSEPPPVRHEDWRGEMMRHLVAAWGWSQGRSVLLDQRDSWRLGTAIEERRDITNTLKESYAALSLFARNHASELKITERDLHVLGRKLYAAFEKKPSKIEIITRGICSNPHEPNLSLHEVKLGDASYVWLLFSGTVTPAEAAFRRPMKRSAAAAELVLWCHLNRLADLTTTWHVFTSATTLAGMDIRRMHDTMAATLGDGENGAGAEDLAAPPRIAHVLLLVNVGVNPFAGTLAEGTVLTSDHSDPFQYGGRGINLVRSIDLLFTTSWNEAFAFRYESRGALLEALSECLAWGTGDDNADRVPSVEARCFSVDHANAIAVRVQQTFGDTLRFMSRRVAGETRQFVMEAGEELHQLRYEEGAPRLDVHTGHATLLRALGQAGHDESFRRVRFDQSGGRLGILAAIYRHNHPDKVQVFARQHGDRADAYILDERGLLLVQRHECGSMHALLEHYQRFLDAALARCVTLGDRGASTAALAIETAEIVSGAGSVQLKPQAIDATAIGDYLSLQVLADADSHGHQQFTILAGEREFSTWEHGGSLFMQVAEYVLAQRRDGATYPIYITDLDLSLRFRQVNGIRTLRPLDLLTFKKRIELLLTRALLRDVPANVVPMAS